MHGASYGATFLSSSVSHPALTSGRDYCCTFQLFQQQHGTTADLILHRALFQPPASIFATTTTQKAEQASADRVPPCACHPRQFCCKTTSVAAQALTLFPPLSRPANTLPTQSPIATAARHLSASYSFWLFLHAVTSSSPLPASFIAPELGRQPPAIRSPTDLTSFTRTRRQTLAPLHLLRKTTSRRHVFATPIGQRSRYVALTFDLGGRIAWVHIEKRRTRRASGSTPRCGPLPPFSSPQKCD